jgi:hypothetical protein
MSPALARRVAAALGEAFVPLDRTAGRAALAIVRHVPSQIDFVLVPGGTFRMGIDRSQLQEIARVSGDLSCTHLDEARASTPVRTVRVAPFLYARSPLSERQAAQGVNFDPVLLTAREAARVVARLGFRLPSEAEWEFVARQGGEGNWLGASNTRTEDPIPAIERACKAVYGRVYRETANEPAINQLGIWGLVLGEWTADGWHANYRRAPSNARAWSPAKVPVIRRGGAGAVWPWQDAGEHIEAHVGLRFHETARDARSFVRVAIDLPANFDWRAGPKAKTKRTRAKRSTAGSKALAAELAVARLVPKGATLVGSNVRCGRRAGPASAYEAVAFVVWIPARGKQQRAGRLDAAAATAEAALAKLIAKLKA